MSSKRARRTAELALLVVCLIWGCNFAVMKSALGELHPFAFNAIRMTMSGAFLGAVHYLRRTERRPLPRGTWPKIFGLALIGYLGYQMVFITGLKRVPSGNAALIVSSSPVFTLLLGFMLGERLRRQAWIGLLIAFAGAATIALEKGVDLGSELVLGNFLMLCAACAWGSYTVLNRGVAEIVPATTLAYYTTLVTVPFHWLIGLPHLEPLWRNEISLSTWIAIAYAGLLGTGCAYILWNVGLKHVGAAHTAGFINLVPVIALFIGWFVLGESVSIIQIAAGACVLGGVWGMRRARALPG